MKRLDKIKGALYGLAFGDALGLGAEFMTRNEARMYYPEGLRHFSQIIRDAHRSAFKRGEWSNDAELTLRMLDCIVETGGLDLLAQAKTMKKWMEDGPIDIVPLFSLILNTPGWEDSPISISHHIWKTRGVTEASNEALVRGFVTGLTSPTHDIVRHTRELVQSTHDDTRCIASATIIAMTAHSLFHNDRLPEYERLKEICELIDMRTIPYLETAHHGRLEDFQLDDEETQLYTRKTMGAALWAMWHTDTPEDAIYSVIDMAGDADTNAAVAGGLAGLRYGYDALPAEKEKLLGKERLDLLAVRLADHLEKHPIERVH